MRAKFKQRETSLWHTQLYTLKSLANFPAPLAIASSRVLSPIYNIPGAERTHEKGTYVFQYTLKGRGELRVKDKRYEVATNKGFLVEVADPDICYYYPKSSHSPWEFLYFVFRESNNLVKTINREYGYVFNLDQESSLIKRLLKIPATGKKVLEMSIGEGSMLVNSVLCTLIDAAREPMTTDSHLHLIRQAHKLIERNISMPYNAGMLSDDLQVSQEHLNRIFSKETQTSPFKLITRIKIREACLLLKETSLSSKEVAQKVGYDPGSHFARMFKREMGMTPLKFRQKGIMPF